METSLRILHIEDNPMDAELIWTTLASEGFTCDVTRVDTQNEFLIKLEQNPYDIILCDYNLPSFDGKSALELALQKIPTVPFIFVSGTIGETRAIETLKRGATDYVLKDDLRRLGPVVRRAIREAKEREQRKDAEKALERSHSQLKYLFDNLDEAFFSQDVVKNKLLQGSPSHEKIYGYPLSEFYKNPQLWYDVILPEDKSIVDATNSELRAGKPVQHQHRIARPDGEIRWLEAKVKPTLDATGTLTRVDGVISDITQRKKAEEELLIQTTYFQQLFENSPEGIVLLDEHDAVLKINKAFETMFRFTISELRGQTLNKFIVPPDKMEEAQKLSLESISGHVVQKDTVRQRKDGERLDIIIIGFPIVINERRVGVYGIYIDITERKKLEAQFYQTQRLESIGTLAGGIAHDFNNILGIILGHATLLEHYASNPQKYMESVQSITRATERGAKMVKQLLTFARKSEISIESFSMNSVVTEIVKLLQETFPKSVQILTSMNPAIPEIVGDSNQIHQVLLNLCVNARDAMPGGGTIKVSTSVFPATKLKVTPPYNPETDFVLLQVSDSGMGMDESTKSRIFEPFFTTKGTGKGTGLGLAVVFGIVESHNGFIEVTSEPGNGTTFSVYFPAKPNNKEFLTPSLNEKKEISGGNELLLVVEDEPLLRELLATLLIDKGYAVLTTADGDEAVSVYRQRFSDISLVLCDLDLPKLNGFEVLKELKKINPKVKFVLASGYIDPNRKSEILKSGTSDILQKPYVIDEMLRKIREGLDRN